MKFNFLHYGAYFLEWLQVTSGRAVSEVPHLGSLWSLFGLIHVLAVTSGQADQLVATTSTTLSV